MGGLKVKILGWIGSGKMELHWEGVMLQIQGLDSLMTHHNWYLDHLFVSPTNNWMIQKLSVACLIRPLKIEYYKFTMLPWMSYNKSFFMKICITHDTKCITTRLVRVKRRRNEGEEDNEECVGERFARDLWEGM